MHPEYSWAAENNGLGDKIGQRKTVAPIAARHLCGESEMTCDERVGCSSVSILVPATCEVLFHSLFKRATC